jgi:hypothetical protein
MDKSSKPTPRPNPSDVQKTVQQPVDQTGASASDPDLSDVQKTVQQPVDQSSTSAPGSNVSGSHTTIQPSPVNPSAASLPKSDPPDPPAERYTRARIFLIFLLLSLNLVFFTNPFVVSTLTIIIGILQVFGDTLAPILKYTDKVFAPLLDFFEWIWRFFFFKPLPYLGRRLIRHRRSIIDIAIIIAIICLLGATTLNPFVKTVGSNLSDSVCLYTHLPWFSCNSGIGVSTLPNGVRIGLITDNTYGPFDQSTLNQGEMTVEELIFNENKQACAGQHITLVVATWLSRTVEDPTSTVEHSVQELQGSYLAQRAYNKPHPAVSICLAIANLGTAGTASAQSTLVKSHPDDYSLPQVIHQIAQFAHANSSLYGIVGFRYSQTATEALNLIKGYQDLSTIPIIAPSASSDALSNVPNFYRIVSPDHSQGTVLAQFFCDSLKQSQSSDSIGMLTDPSSAYSRSLQLAFNNALTCGDPRDREPHPYTNYDASSIRPAVDQALQQNPAPKYIFFPGYDTDMDTVELEIHNKGGAQASEITIIGGDGTNNVDATTYYSYNHIYNTTFVGPLLDTTDSLATGDPLVTGFKQQRFDLPPSPYAIQSHVWIPANAVLGYDAVNAFVEAVKKVSRVSLTQDKFNNALSTIVFHGESGEIQFQGTSNNGHTSNRNQGYIYITCNDLAHNTHLIAGYSTVNDGISPPQNLHLSQADGVSSCS